MSLAFVTCALLVGTPTEGGVDRTAAPTAPTDTSGTAPTDAPRTDTPPAETAKPPETTPPDGATEVAKPPAEPPSASPPSGPAPTPPSTAAPTPPSGTPPTPPSGATDAALAPQKAQAAAGAAGAELGADAAGKLADRVAEGAQDLAARDGGAPPEEQSPVTGTEVPVDSLTDEGRHPIGQGWDEIEQPVQREEVVTVVHTMEVRPLPPPPRVHEPEPLGIGGFAGVSLRGSALNRNPSMWIGARGGVIFGGRFAIGGAFHQATARFGGPIVGSRGEKLGLRAAYGGLTFDWVVWERGKIDLGIESLAGAGSACVSRSASYRDNDWKCIESVRMFVVEAGFNVTYTARDWMRIGTSLGWRFVARQAWRPPNDFSLAGPYLALNFDFGLFG